MKTGIVMIIMKKTDLIWATSSSFSMDSQVLGHAVKSPFQNPRSARVSKSTCFMLYCFRL